MTNALDEPGSVGDKNERSAVINDFLHPLHALVLKLLITDREHFVDDEDFRLKEGSD